MIADKGCAKRGCACYDDRTDKDGVEMVEKKEWIGLTDEEREFLLNQALRFYDTNAQLLSFIKTVEAKLKEKNNAL